MIVLLQYGVVGAIAAMVALGELLSRYRDDPWAVVWRVPALFYLLINVLAAAVGFHFLNSYSVLPPETTTFTKVLVAGFGAMAIFRTSVFTARVGSTDIAIGPSAFLQIVLAAVDRGIDRNQAEFRARIVPEIMKGISFEKAKTALPVFCFALMQNVDQAEQQRVGTQVNDLAAMTTMDDQMKAYSLGLILINIVGEGVLRAAIEQAREQLKI